MKKQSLIFLLLVVLLNPAFAMKQTVQICLNVRSHSAENLFQMGFISTDLFDTVTQTHFISNGQDCAQTTYYDGPKSLTFFYNLKRPKDAPYFQVQADDSCMRFYSSDYGKYKSNPQRTGSAYESWTFTITDIPDQNFYNMSCKRENH